MELIALVFALAVGYVIGLMQHGITIKKGQEDEPINYNKSVGIDEFKEYHEQTGGMNKF